MKCLSYILALFYCAIALAACTGPVILDEEEEIFEMESDDLIYLCRTAINNANNFHDANYSIFDRIKL